MLQKLQALFEKIATQVENNPTPFARYIQLFFAILVVRLALEFFSGNRLFTLADILHIGLWFTFIVLAFLLQLHLFSGEKILKIAKLGITFFTIALSAPIIDLLIFGGQGVKMNYLSLNSWSEVVWSYITIGGSSLSRGATPGIRIEIVLLLMACFNYVRTKRKSIIAGLVAAFSIYTVLFLSGAIPAILGLIVTVFHLQYESSDQSTVLLLLSLDMLLLLVALARHSPERIFSLLKSAPWAGIVTALMYAVIGAWLALQRYPDNWKLTPTTLFWFPLLAGLVLCFMALTGGQRMQGNVHAGKDHQYRIGNVLLTLILVLGLAISARTFFAVTLIWGLLFLLNEAPLYLGKIPLLGNLLAGMVLLAAALLGFSTFGAPMVGFPGYWLIGLLMGGMIGSVLVQLISSRKVNN